MKMMIILIALMSLNALAVSERVRIGDISECKTYSYSKYVTKYEAHYYMQVTREEKTIFYDVTQNFDTQSGCEEFLASLFEDDTMSFTAIHSKVFEIKEKEQAIKK